MCIDYEKPTVESLEKRIDDLESDVCFMKIQQETINKLVAETLEDYLKMFKTLAR